MKPTVPRPYFALLALATAGALSGCAGAGALSQGSAPELSAIETSAATNPDPDYKLSPEEAELNCKRLAGKVQIRILEFRSGLKPEESSAIARAIDNANAFAEGSTAGPSVAEVHKKDVAQLYAYNKQLADKNCKSFDIAKALASTDTVPSPTVQPKKPAH